MEFKKGDYVSLDLDFPRYAVGIHSEKQGRVLCYAFNYSFELHLSGYSPRFRKATKKERKVDTTKKRLLMDCKVLLEGLGAEILGIKTETEVTFTFEGEEYSLKLIKHRPKKE